MADTLAVYRTLLSAQVRSQMQYWLGFLLSLVTAFVATVVDFVGLTFLLHNAPAIAGWRLAELALLYGLVNVPFAVAHLVGEGFEDFRDYIRSGTLDPLLLRPRAIGLQVAGSGLALRQLGRLAQAALVLGLALAWLGAPGAWTAWQWLLLSWAMLGGLAFYLGVFLCSATLCFWTVESVEVANIVTYGSTEMAVYPMPIFGRWLRRMFTYLVPLAFVNYYPALLLLGRSDPSGLPGWTGWLAPVVAGAMLPVGLALWRIGLRHYQSTGT